jgi:hypothetical protein
MGLVPKRLPSSEMGGLGEPRQGSVRATCQGAPVDITCLPVLMNTATARVGAMLVLSFLRQVECLTSVSRF